MKFVQLNVCKGEDTCIPSQAYFIFQPQKLIYSNAPKSNVTKNHQLIQRNVLSPRAGETPLPHWVDPSGSRKPLLGLDCTVSWPPSLSVLRGKLKGTTSPLEPCVLEAPAVPQY